LDVSPFSLMFYNGMEEDEEFLYEGDWLLIPRASPEP
jgi:hypothetical protein